MTAEPVSQPRIQSLAFFAPILLAIFGEAKFRCPYNSLSICHMRLDETNQIPVIPKISRSLLVEM